MQITRGTDYAVRVMVHLATLPEGTRVPVTELARVVDVPSSFVSKVLQQLVRAGMVSSLRGMGGGFTLAADPAKVNLLHVVEAIEGPLQINWCLPGEHTCDRRTQCAAHPYWQEAQAALKDVLSRASIARLARDSANIARNNNRPITLTTPSADIDATGEYSG